MNSANIPTPTLEQRVAALEATVRDLQAQGRNDKSWLERVSGILENETEFGKVIEYGRYWRKHGEEPPQAGE